MVLESTIFCVDNSEYMRNGDFIPSRLQAQQDAVGILCHYKTRMNPENNVGLLTLSNNPQVLTTLTTDVGRILSKLHQVTPCGDLNFVTGIRIAHLALKHRQGKNHKMRIVAFVGSPLEIDGKELVKLAKRLKKEKVNVDIVNFGEESINADKLTFFVNTLNGKDGTGSHLVTVPPSPDFSEALVASPIVRDGDGNHPPGLAGPGGLEFGFDPNEDPELALALRVSMEEQRARQEEDARKAAAASVAASSGTPTSGATAPSTSGVQTPTDGSKNLEEALLERALAMSFENDNKSSTADNSLPDFASMTEAEQIRYALAMSLQPVLHQDSSDKKPESPVPMETDDNEKPEDLEQVIRNLPGVIPSQLEDKSKKDKEKKDDQQQ